MHNKIAEAIEYLAQLLVFPSNADGEPTIAQLRKLLDLLRAAGHLHLRGNDIYFPFVSTAGGLSEDTLYREVAKFCARTTVGERQQVVQTAGELAAANQTLQRQHNPLRRPL